LLHRSVFDAGALATLVIFVCYALISIFFSFYNNEILFTLGVATREENISLFESFFFGK